MSTWLREQEVAGAQRECGALLVCLQTGVIVMRNPGMLLDVTVKSGGAFEAQVSEEFNAFCYVCDGAGKICGQSGVE